jgi:nitroreductase
MAPSRAPTDPCIRALEGAADLAVLAPSVHNTQPWRIVMHADHLELWADRSRGLPALDPDGRALVQSVGAALLNVRVGLAAEGWAAEVDRLPSSRDPDLLAVVHAVAGRPDPALAELGPAVARRHTNRRRFTAEPVPDDDLARLVTSAAAEETQLLPVLDEVQVRLVARLTREAEAAQTASPAYRAELRRWTSRPAAAGDGIPPSAVPHVGPDRRDDPPQRDFDTQGRGTLPWDPGTPGGQTVLLLATRDDDQRAWLRSGEAMQRVLLLATALGWVASPLTQAIEVPEVRARLRDGLTGAAHPQLVLRIGRAPETGPVPRRSRTESVANSWQPPQPAADRPRPPERPGPRHPVPDGRGGTRWV